MIRGEAGVSLKRRRTGWLLNKKGGFSVRHRSFYLSLRDTTTTLFGTSYFCIFYIPSQMGKFNLSLIPEFDSSPTDPSIVEWFADFEQVCKLFRNKEPSMVILLRLTKGAYAVYQQLGDDADLEKIKCALYTAFGTDPFIAWKQFVRWQLKPSETVDVYLADLRKLAVPFGGATDHILECAFLAGLPDDISRLLRSSSRLDELGIDELLARTRNILKDTELVASGVRTT